jgi:arabinofuranosyltransferase
LERADDEAWRPWVVAGLLAAIAFYLVRCGVFWEHLNDDAYITFRYSRFLATGRGPYFNPGEQVEGYTNFLWMTLLAQVFRFGGEAAVPWVAKSLGVACGVGNLLLAWALTRRLLSGHALLSRYAGAIGVGAAALVAVSPAFALHSTSGLETTLFGFLLLLGVSTALRAEADDRWRGAGLAFAAMVLTRPEGAYLFAFAWLGLAVAAWRRSAEAPPDRRALLRRRDVRRLLLDGGLVTLVFAAQLVFRLAYYDGEWLPNTYYAKAGGFWKIDAWSYVRPGILTPVLGVLGVLLALPGAWLTLRRVPEALSLFLLATAGATLPFVTGPAG